MTDQSVISAFPIILSHSRLSMGIRGLDKRISVKPTEPDASGSEKRLQRRQTIVESAARLFADIGYTACEMERVATEAGIAKGTLYLYFPGKQELFFACVDWGMKSMQEAVRAAAASVPDSQPFDRFGRAIREYLAFFERHPEYVELLIQERGIFKDRKRPTYFEYRSANIGYWKEQWRQMIASGRIRG